MKVTKQQASEHRAALINAASISILERGFEGSGVADLSRKAGLTHGAFYSHFSSKDDLAAEACDCAFERCRTKFSRLSLEKLINQYLSVEHRKDLSHGCPSVLAAEIGRQNVKTQARYAEGIERFVTLISAAKDSKGRTVSREIAISITASLMGGLSLARALVPTNPSLSEEVLENVRHAVHALASNSHSPVEDR